MSNEQADVLVLIGTRKGGFILSSDINRKKWEIKGPVFKGWNVMHMAFDPRDQRLHAAVVHDVYGPSTHYSDDFGESWTQGKKAPIFSRPSKSSRPLGTPEEAKSPEEAKEQIEKVLKVWHIRPAGMDKPGFLYAGVEPAALFISTDRGETWQLNTSLYDHPHRADWFPGAGGLCLHTIIPDPVNPERIYVAVSTGGCYRTDDGGKTWNPYNKNVRADFLPDKFPEYGQCVHKMVIHPDRPETIFQQNHCGVYRSDNQGKDWIDIGDQKLPSRFGFPIAVHPHDPETIYIVLEESDQYRLSVDGSFAVWRSQDSGDSWQRITEGLPGKAHLVVLREAMATDQFEEAGIYIGTSTGQVFASNDSGDSWEKIVDYLPRILSVETATLT
ncbi:MAG: exo-alpha-sialidase [Chloroflexota bacterium]|nr:MAG: exo-alpha-sialidase [Chloroflexota bacterium]